MTTAIVNNRIAGTRITVWDIFHYLESGERPEYIAEVLKLSLEQVHAAIEFIEANKDFVMQVHREIEERIARGNPPWVEALREEGRLKMQEWLKQKRLAESQERNGEGHPV